MTEHTPILIEDDPNIPQPVPQKSKTSTKVVYSALAVIAAVIVIFAYWTIQPSDPLQITNSPFPVRTVHQASSSDNILILTVDYCKKDDATGTVRTSFVSNSREVFLPLGKEQMSTGCKHNVEVPVLIPKDLPADTYKIKFRTSYDINPLKRGIVQDFESRPFTVSSNGDLIIPQP